MVICFMGESCVGKSTVAERLKALLNAELFTGNDYLRLAGDEVHAKTVFTALLKDSQQDIIYVVSEKEQLALLPEGAIRILITADLDVIKARFTARMQGQLPPPVAAMLERKHGMFDAETHNLHIKSGDGTPEDAAQRIQALCESMR